MYSFFKINLTLVVFLIFGPGAFTYFHFFGDFYSLSKTWPIFDVITPEWLLLLGFFIFWVAFYSMLTLYQELLKYIHRPPILDWWQKEVIYQIYVKSFYDSNQDGYGDLKGVTKKLDYLNHIGIKTIWLTPFYQSGGKDGGYDVTSLTKIDSTYGQMKDFDELIEKAHEKSMHVLMDFVPNHTSDQHEWFIKSCESGSSSNPYRDYYVWVESKNSQNPPNNWTSVFGQSAWTYNHTRKAWYLHQFLKEQPDLNFRCPKVQEEMKKALVFWLETKKVDGFRIDAFKHIFEDKALRDEPAFIEGLKKEMKYDDLDHIYTSNQDETFELLRDWRNLFESISKRTNSTKALIVECGYRKTEELIPYYKYKNQHMAHFPFNFQFLGLNKINGREFRSKELMKIIKEYLEVLPKGCWPNWQLGNHDNSRVSTRVGQENVNIANTLNLLLGGTSLIYYGEEIGMEDLPIDSLDFEDSKDEFGKKYGKNEFMNYSRDYSRTPMQWSSSKNCGFTQSEKSWLPINQNASIRNVQRQLNDPESNLNIVMKLMKLRELPSFQWGKLKIHVVDDQIFSFTRKAFDFPSFLVVMNISDVNVRVTLETSSEIAPRAYVRLYIPGISTGPNLSKVYTSNAPVLTRNVSLNARDCLVLSWAG